MERMAKKRVLFINGVINSEGLEILREKLIGLCEDSNEPVIVLIDSNGGDLEEVWGFCDIIPMLSNVIIGVVVGKCYSAAFAILQACDLRLATSNSRFVPHHITVQMSYSMYRSDKEIIALISRSLIEARRSQERLEDIVVNRSGKRRPAVSKLFIYSDALDAKMDIDEALEEGLIDHVVSSIAELKSKIKSAKKFLAKK